jgi:hypothetical protein
MINNASSGLVAEGGTGPQTPAARERQRRVLILGADLGPSSYPQALRARFFARHLPEFGSEPVILPPIPVSTKSRWKETMAHCGRGGQV